MPLPLSFDLTGRTLKTTPVAYGESVFVRGIRFLVATQFQGCYIPLPQKMMFLLKKIGPSAKIVIRGPSEAL